MTDMDENHPTTVVKWWDGECQHRIQVLDESVVHDTRESGGGWATRDEWNYSEWDEPQYQGPINDVPTDNMESQY